MKLKSTARGFLQERRFELLLTLYVPFYLCLFFFVEAVVPTEGYWVSQLPIDNRIPFWAGAIVFYYLWFPFQAGTGLFLLFRDPAAYRRFIYFMMLGFTTALLICLMFPNGQDLRPARLEGGGILTRMVAAIYAVDTNTNVFPSVHVIGSMMAMNGWFDSKPLRRGRGFAAILAICICASTVLVKQHSVLDLAGGLLVCAPVWYLVYRKRF